MTRNQAVLAWVLLLGASLGATGFAWMSSHPLRSPFLRPVSSANGLSAISESQTDFETQSAPPLVGSLIASDAISQSELSTLQELIQACTPVTIASTCAVPIPLEKLAPGATGRVAFIELASSSIDEEFLEEWQVILCQQIDEILYSEEEDSVRQPILLWFAVGASPASREDLLLSRIRQEIVEYGLVVETKHSSQHENHNNASKFVPSLRYEVDGAVVQDDDNQESPVWDTSSVVVLDDLVSPDLRARMLQVVLGPTDWKDAQYGPDPSRWSEGGLIDLPDQEERTNNEDVPISYGLTDQALEEICQDSPTPPAFQEFESLLATLLEDFIVTRLPEAVLGAGVTPLTANAPCHGQTFSDHIDADPFFAPPSPWTDVFGRYANRARGKPRFVSCLVYLNDEWKAQEWGAPTRFYDVASGTAVDVSPKPGRVVLMDQDVTHTVVPPLEAAGKRPRYSLVWKLVLHPNKHQQDMRSLAKNNWPEPIYVGSAKR